MLALVPLSGAGAASTTGCRVNTYSAFELGDGIYMYGTAKEFWQESNGVAGLQRTTSFCSDGRSIAPDTCITHSETFAAVICGFEYAGSTFA